MAKDKILIVDDEAGARFGIRRFFEAKGWEVFEAEDCKTAESVCSASRPDFAVLDLRLPDGDAVGLLPRLKEIDPELPVIMLTGHGTIDVAVQAIKEGAEHFLTKPVELPALFALVERATEHRRDRRKRHAGEAKVGRDEVDPFHGTSHAIRVLAEQAQKILSTDSPVLIQGETGSGKGVLAEWLHRNGPRAQEAFLDLNCAGLSKEFLETELFGHQKGAFTGALSTKSGLMEVAHRGTFFLDEVGDMDLQVQAKVLKVLEEKRFRRLGDTRDRSVDVRLIAATHMRLDALVQEGRFRSDLYFRISTIPLYVPALRERAEDILPLSTHILRRIASDLGRGADLALGPDAEEALRKYAWPGNIRELRNVLERAVLLSSGTVLTRKDLIFGPPTSDPSPPDDAELSLSEMEERHVRKVLAQHRGHVETAAGILGVPRSTLYQKIKKYGIDPSEF